MPKRRHRPDASQWMGVDLSLTCLLFFEDFNPCGIRFLLDSKSKPVATVYPCLRNSRTKTTIRTQFKPVFTEVMFRFRKDLLF